MIDKSTRDKYSFQKNPTNIICRQPPSSGKGAWFHSLPFPVELILVTSLQFTAFREGKIVTWQWSGLAPMTSTKWWRLVWAVMAWGSHAPPDRMWWDEKAQRHSTSGVVFLKKIWNFSLLMKRTLEKPKLRLILQNTRSVPFKMVMVLKNNKSIRNCLRPKGTG